MAVVREREREREAGEPPEESKRLNEKQGAGVAGIMLSFCLSAVARRPR